MTDEYTRRDVLGTGAAIGSTAVVGALAGCSSLGGGSGGSFSDVSRWLPTLGALDSSLDHYTVNATSPSRFANLSNSPIVAASYTPGVAFANPTASDVDAVVNATAEGETRSQQFTAYAGSFNRDWSTTRLENDEQWENDREVEGYSIYGRPGGGGTVEAIGVSSDGYVNATDDLATSDSPDAASIVETIVNAATGAEAGSVDENDDLGELGQRLPFGHQVSNAGTMAKPEETNAESGRFAEQVARGRNVTIDGESATETRALVFSSEGAIDETDIETFIEDSGRFSEYGSKPAFSVSGRTVTIEGSKPTSTVAFTQ